MLTKMLMSRILVGPLLIALGLIVAIRPVFAQAGCISWTAVNEDGSRWRITACPDNAPTATPTATTPGQATATPTPPGTPTVTPAVTPQPPGEPSAGLWISPAEVKQLPMTGPAWSAVLSAANSNPGAPDLDNQDSSINVTVLAQALAWARTDDEKYRAEVVEAIRSIVSTQSESGGRTLALGRELAAYVAAADLIDLRNHDPKLHNDFKLRLAELRNKNLDGMTLSGCHERRANNWGTHCGASRAAINVYIGDKADLDRTADVFEGWLGNRAAYSGFTYGSSLDWQCNPSAPVGINPQGCTKSGWDIGGALPDDMRRGGGFKMPNPSETGYACGGLSGAVAQAEILHRAGYPAYEWGDRALYRAMEFLRQIGWQCNGDDEWLDVVINFRYGTSYPVSDQRPGKNMGWSQWTHGAGPVALPAEDVIIVDDNTRIATGESPGDLADEVEYLTGFGWVAVGEQYTTVGEDGIVYAQMMTK